ncbi:MAG: PRC-barrel domain-containing protein [Sandaracinaceae bacterium]
MSQGRFDGALRDRDVLTQDGREIGKLSDIVIDHDSWKVVALTVRLDRDLLERFELKKPMFGTQELILPIGFISGVGDKIVLHQKLEAVIEHVKREGGAATTARDEDDHEPAD